jgi:hypothetical protein
MWVFCEAYRGKVTVAKAYSKTTDPSENELRSQLATEGGLSAFYGLLSVNHRFPFVNY